MFMHWGKEYLLTPNQRLLRIANHLHSLGAHIVIGSHQHVLQGHIYNTTSNITLKYKQRAGVPKTATIIRKRRTDFTAFAMGNLLFGQHGTPFKVSDQIYCLVSF